jgi:hypothetical protein
MQGYSGVQNENHDAEISSPDIEYCWSVQGGGRHFLGRCPPILFFFFFFFFFEKVPPDCNIARFQINYIASLQLCFSSLVWLLLPCLFPAARFRLSAVL